MKRILFLFSIVSIVLAGSPSEWKSRTIYQLFTDRFGGGTGSCGNLQNYCGGTWQGIIEHLDYIQGMGFDAIWISPIPENYPGGYHGYWQTNFEQVNSNFGTSNDLQQLIKECHSRGIWVMLDVVANHIGPVTDYSTVVPFNSTEYYHDCTPCPSGCAISDWSNQAQVEWCRLANLPDLDQSNNFVDTYLVNWIKDTVSSYGFDGIRIDTTPEVPKSFWDDYVAASGVYAVGEVFNGNIQYVASYTKPQGPLDGALSYPLFFTLRDVFANKNSMYELQNVNQQYISNFADLNLMGTFIDNHDNERFLNIQSDLSLYRNALVYVLFSSGVPIIYYGTEQGFNGGKDPNNRECLWPTQYNTQSPLYEFLSTVISYRKQAQIWTYPQVQRYADNNFYAFTRGNTFVAMTNVGSGGSQLQRTITYHPYSNGVKLCNLFYPTVDCIMVQNGSFTVYLDEGEVKIYHPV